MLLETNKEKICMSQIIGQKKDVFTVEEDIIVNDIKPDILNIINASGTVCVYKKEVQDGKVKLDGCVNVYIMYLADDENGNVRSLNTVLDFTQTVDMDSCRGGMQLDSEINIKSIDCKVINSRKLNIKAILDLNIKVLSNEEIEIINDVNNIEDIQILNKNLEMNSLIGTGETKSIVKDTITLDSVDNLAEILSVKINIINTETKTSYNKVLAKSDANCKIMYLTEDNRIKTMEENIPVMGFIDMPNVSDSNVCDTKYKLCNLILKPNNAEEHSIYIEMEFELTCFTYEKKCINIIEDLYSPTKQLSFTQKKINTTMKNDAMKEICSIKEELSIPEIKDNKIYDVEVMPIIQKTKVQNNKISYEGETIIKVFFESSNTNRLDVKTVKLPLNFIMNANNVNEDTNIETNIEIKNQNFVVLQGGYVNSLIDLEFKANIENSQTLSIINEIEEEEKRVINEYSVIIYFVKEKDTLWNIAKQFKTTIEDIVKINNIEDANKIYPGMKLFIPKYVRKIPA